LNGVIEHAGKLDSSGDHRGRGELDSDDLYNIPEIMHNVTFGAAMFSKDLYNIVGELNEERYPHFVSDVEYCERVKSAGYSIWYVPVRLEHCYGKSSRPYLFDDLPDELLENGKPARKIWQ
jgi:GT2 family glycosyltransferase